MNFRFARKEDLNSCVELDLHRNTEKILNKIKSNEVIVVEYDNDIIGCLKIEYLWTHLPFISYIVIKENYRKLGVAHSLLKFLEEYLKDSGQTILLSSTMTNNLNSQKWHLSKGFEECGILAGINENKIGELFYKKNL
ncbi:GNAT family N-acetyltransferase [Clostridium tarantellae]|uniref:GNAT family N-acetyltransferase n=1 Tax=Clostridium tarantellae TaxID=39493 RepID=A0A6I1MQ36_9CLOT|nr:GNAT family N-acetyltransferase [Clostridium tarantellae]MPQ44247.1 GNAT family N-acetyltransferase [Clostridium tarantellae]